MFTIINIICLYNSYNSGYLSLCKYRMDCEQTKNLEWLRITSETSKDSNNSNMYIV